MVSGEAPPVAPSMPVRGARRTTAWSLASARGLIGTAVLLVAVAAVAVIGLVVVDRDDRTAAAPVARTSSTAKATTGALTARALSWVDRSLPHDAVVLADGVVAPALASRGFSPVGPDAAAGHRIQFVVSTPTLRAAAASHPAVAAALRGSLPVALMPSTGAPVTVRQVAAVSRADMAGDARTRRDAERQLLVNPALQVDPAAAGVLRAGGLDLRAATVLALLASNQRVEIVAIDSDPAEHAAGRPARRVDIRVGSSAAVRAQLDVVASQYQVATVQTRLDRIVRLVWPIDVTPVAQPN